MKHLTYTSLPDYFFAPAQMANFPKLERVIFNEELAREFNIAHDYLPQNSGIAQAYAGHQFGHFTMLGDGRAMLIDEIRDRNGKIHDLHLKGSGPTPFSRRGDGRAGLKPMLREFAISESLHALGIPTSRILAVFTTGEKIRREQVETGALVVRVAESHLRVGSFEFAHASGQSDAVQKLADYAINRHFPALMDQLNPYLALLHEVIARQAKLIAQWMGVGFVHGVMNTDNMTISGQSLDFGPCAFMDYFSDSCVFSSIDHQGRYAYGNQPAVAHWNLARFAETLLPLIDENHEKAIEIATAELGFFEKSFTEHYYQIFAQKLGLTEINKAKIHEALESLKTDKADFTRSFSPSQHNPIYIPRNTYLQNALDLAEEGRLDEFLSLVDLIRNPFDRKHGFEKFEGPPLREESESFISFCGT